MRFLSRIIGVAAVVLLATFGCSDDDPTFRVAPRLQFRFLSGTIGANLMPIVPPDPIQATVSVEVSNLTGDTVSVTVPGADVFLVRTNAKLGRIDFATAWGGRLNPGQVDTLTVAKINAGVKLFDPPCTEDVVLRITGQSPAIGSVTFDSDTLTFGCVF
ncbi:MAG: hypothetical protein V3V49_13750 [Candidatus Krumholzibacteria bacterium]